MASMSTAVMIGRAAELADLTDAFASTADAGPRIVVVGGEAGIGKSRLLDEFRAALDDSAVVVTGHCVEFGTVGLPYVPLAGIFRGLAAAFGDDAVFEAAGAGQAALRGLIEGVQPVERDERMGIQRLDEVVTTLLERLSADEPLVVMIEDLHWADAATLDVLRFAARVLTAGKLLIVLTYRSDDVGRGHPLRAFLAELERNRRTTRISLSRLSAREVKAQASSLLGGTPSVDQVRELYQRSEGIPFFVEELVGVDLVAEGAPVPETLRDLLLGRYEYLHESAQQVVRVLAAGGARVDHDVLTEVAGMAADELDAALRQAVDAGVVVVDGRGYDFRHALVREAVAAELLPGESARIHTGYARALASRAGDPTQRAARAVLVSYHWMEAHDLDRAFEASLEGARLSRAAFAYTSAAQLGERALSLWDRVADPAGAAQLSHVELLDFTAVSWRNAGEPQRALATIELALNEADPTQRETVARLLRNKGVMLTVDGRAEAIRVFEQALRVLHGEGDPMLRANILAESAAQYMVSGRPAEAIAAASEALELAPEAAHRTRSIAANVRGGTLIFEGRIEEGLADYELARQLARGDRDALLRYHVNRSDALHLLGRFSESIAVAEEGFELARAAGVERTSGAILTVNTVDPLFALGEWGHADALIDASLELNPPAVFRTYLRRAKVRSTFWRGDPSRALELFGHWSSYMTDLAAYENQTRAHLALDIADLQVAVGDLDAAWQWASVLLTEERLASSGYELPLAPTVARIIARRRESGRYGSHDADAARLREVVARDAWPTQALWSAFVDAELSGADGIGSDVPSWLRARDAVAAPEAPVLARMLVEHGLARAQVLSGDRAAAAETIDALRVTAGELGAGLLVQWSDDLRSRAGVGTRHASTASEDGALTSREQQVLELVAEGLSNGQIAERLYISRKTVSVHVSAILRKLGAASRTEAVRLAALATDEAR